MNDRLLDQPVHKDWITHLWAVAVVIGVWVVVKDVRFAGGSYRFSVGMILEVVFAVGTQTFLFLVIPANIRRGYRG